MFDNTLMSTVKPHKRNHPHTRKEWEDVRPIFTKLHQVEGRPLSDIVRILDERGFHAKEHHFKTHIRKWGLSKYKKHSDMAFARQKLLDRHGKQTIFIMQGRQFTSPDIKQYWRRKPPQCTSPPMSAKTPDGVSYGTPIANNNDDVVGFEPKDLDGEASLRAVHSQRKSGSSASDVSMDFSSNSRGPVSRRTPSRSADDEAVRSYAWSPSMCSRKSQQLVSYRRQSLSTSSTSWYSLRTPGPLKGLHQAIHGIHTYCCSFVGRMKVYSDPSQDMERATLVRQFSAKAYDARAAVMDRLSSHSVEIVRRDMLKLVPQLAQYGGPVLVVEMLDIVLSYDINISLSPELANELRLVRAQIVFDICNAFGQVHPISLVLRSLNGPLHSTKALSTTLVRLISETVVNGIGCENLETLGLLGVASQVARRTGDTYAALQYAQELYQAQVSKSGGDVETWDLVDALRHLACAHYTLRDYTKTESVVMEGLRLCHKLARHTGQNDFRGRFVYLQGQIRWNRGDLRGAIESLTEALNHYLRWYGPGHYDTSNTAFLLQKVIEEQNRVERQPEVGSQGHPPGTSVVGGQDPGWPALPDDQGVATPDVEETPPEEYLCFTPNSSHITSQVLPPPRALKLEEEQQANLARSDSLHNLASDSDLDPTNWLAEALPYDYAVGLSCLPEDVEGEATDHDLEYNQTTVFTDRQDEVLPCFYDSSRPGFLQVAIGVSSG